MSTRMCMECSKFCHVPFDPDWTPESGLKVISVMEVTQQGFSDNDKINPLIHGNYLYFTLSTFCALFSSAMRSLYSR